MRHNQRPYFPLLSPSILHSFSPKIKKKKQPSVILRQMAVLHHPHTLSVLGLGVGVKHMASALIYVSPVLLYEFVFPPYCA